MQMSVKLLGETDAFEESLPVARRWSRPRWSPRTGRRRPQAREALELPAGVDPGCGGLRLELASTALVGLGEGARYLVDVSLRLRRAARLGRARPRCWPPTSARPSACPASIPAEAEGDAAADR